MEELHLGEIEDWEEAGKEILEAGAGLVGIAAVAGLVYVGYDIMINGGRDKK